MKICNQCHISKPPDEFYRNSGYKDGHLSRCKSCCLEYDKSPTGRKRMKKWRSSEKGKANKILKHNSYDWSEYSRKYRSTNKGQETTKEYDAQYKQIHMDRIRSNHAIMRAIKTGKIIKPDTCQNCGKQHHDIHGHHWSYLPEHRLDIIWLCPSCHKLIHQNTATSST